jgi:restriction endonuclease S subunit
VLVYDNNSKNIDISFGKLITINKSTVDVHPESFLKPLDIVLTVAGSHIGLVSILPIEIPAMTFMLNLSCIAFRVKNNSIDPYELFCYLRSEDAQVHFKSITQGTSAAYITKSNLMNLQISL